MKSWIISFGGLFGSVLLLLALPDYLEGLKLIFTLVPVLIAFNIALKQ